MFKSLGKMINLITDLISKPEGKRPLVRSYSRPEGNVKKKNEDVVWIHLAQDRYRWQSAVNTVMNNTFPYKTRDFVNSRGTIRTCRRIRLHEISSLHVRKIGA
jgi:hypothetical protein